jgi:hypothetical protein
MKKLPFILVAHLLLLTLPFPAAPNRTAAAAPPYAALTVTNLLDPGSAACEPSDCSLRAAISKANSDGVETSIAFGSSLNGTLTLASPLPALTDVNATGIYSANYIRISGGGLYPLFTVDSGAKAGLSHLELVNGKSSTPGAAISNAGELSIMYCIFSNNQSDAGGGAIYNATPGVVDIDVTIFTANQASRGGAIYNASSVENSGAGTMVIRRSFFEANEATAEGGAVYNAGAAATILWVYETSFRFNVSGSNGGAIYQGNGAATVENSSFSDNHAVNGAALANGTGWTLTARNVTITRNSASAGGSVYNASGALTLRNTIVANQTAGVNCVPAMPITNLGNNIDSGTSCGWGTANGSMSNTDPHLTSMGNYLSGTQVFGLSLSSPALDGVTYAPLDCPARDQRGYPRPVDGNKDGTVLCDIGAFESSALSPYFIPLMLR